MRRTPSSTLPAGRRPAALGFIYAAAGMNMVSQGVIIPVFPVLVKSLTGQGDAGAAQIMGVFAAAWAVMQLTFAPIFGNLSDRFGRRPVLLVAMFGLALDYVIMALAPSIAWLFVGRLISGVTSSSGSAAGAYVADVSNEDNRARNFGRFQAALNAGIFIGPLIGGVGAINARAPFWIAAGLAFANGLYGLFIIPESLSHERRAPFRWARANPVGAARLLISRQGLLGMASILFITQFASFSFNSIFQFYTHHRYGWGPASVALLLMVLSGSGIVIQSFVAGSAARRLTERGAVIAGLGLCVVGYACIGQAPTEVLFWAALTPVMLGGIAFPSLMSLLSKRVGVDEQGQLQGALAILFGITALVGPLIFTNIFAWSIGPGSWLHAPGLPFFFGSALLTLSTALAVAFARPAAPRPDPLSDAVSEVPSLDGLAPH